MYGGLQEEAVGDQAALSTSRRPRELGLDQGSAALQVEAKLFGLMEAGLPQSAARAPREALLSGIYSENRKEVFPAAGLAPDASGDRHGPGVVKSPPEFPRFRTAKELP